jgi:hypothetical protein
MCCKQTYREVHAFEFALTHFYFGICIYVYICNAKLLNQPVTGPAADDEESAIQLPQGSGTVSALDYDRIDEINLTVIASGVSRLGHKRSRLKKLRDEWSMSPESWKQDWAQRFNTKLANADIAEEFSKPEIVQSMSDEVFKTKLDALVLAGTVIPCNVAVEVTNFKSKRIGASVVVGESEVL